MASSDDDARAATISAEAARPIDPSGATVAASGGDGSGGSGGGTLASISDLVRARSASADAALGDDDSPRLGPVDPKSYVRGETLAVGGMGRIVAARDRRLGRKVAIKEVRAGSSELRRRFEREVVLTARLQHPNIITVHEAGTWPDGEPFYAMKLVAGRSLDKVVAERKTLPERLALLPAVIAVADALAYAHKERVIHRDLKPANVLVGDFGETVVIDWGLAKDLAASEPGETGAPRGADHAADDTLDAIGPYREAAAGGETAYGAVLGTPAYMPPEQARGEAVDERADVYSLGALLYHVLSGRPPVEGNSVEDVIASVITKRVEPVRARDARIPRELDTIITKAMAPAPAERYPTAVELAEDLRRFQTGQLVGAHHYSPWQLAQRWMRRHRAGLAILAMVVILGAGAGVFRIQKTRRERDAATATAAIADAAAHTLLVEEGRREALDDHPLRALALLRAALAKPVASPSPSASPSASPASSPSSIELDFLLGRTLPFAASVDHRFEGGILDARYTDGDRHILTVSDHHDVTVWDAATAAVVRTVRIADDHTDLELGHSEAFAIAATGDRRSVVDLATGAVGDEQPTYHVVYNETGTRVWRIGPFVVVDRAGGGEARMISPAHEIVGARAQGSDLLLVTGADLSGTNIVRLHDDGQAITQVASHPYSISADPITAVISADLDHIAIMGRDIVERFTADGSGAGASTGGVDDVLALSEDGSELATCTYQLVEVEHWTHDGPNDSVQVELPTGGDLQQLAFDGDGGRLLAVDPSGQIFVIDAHVGRVLATLTAEVRIQHASFSRDGTHVVAALVDGSAQVWNVARAGDLPTVSQGVRCAAYDAAGRVVAFRDEDIVDEGTATEIPAESAGHCTMDESGHRVASLTQDGVRITELSADAPIVETLPEHGRVSRIALAPGGHVVAVRVASGELHVFTDGKQTATWHGPTGITGQDDFAFSSDGTHLMLTDLQRSQLALIDAASGSTSTLDVPRLAVARWSPDGARFATGSSDGTLRVWRTADHAVVFERPRLAQITDIAFSPASGDAFTASTDGVVRQWTPTGKLVRATRVTRASVTEVSVDPRGALFVAASSSFEATLWSVASGDLLARLPTHEGHGITHVGFNRDGTRVFALADNGGVQQWATQIEPHALADVTAIVDKAVPWTVENGVLVPRALLDDGQPR